MAIYNDERDPNDVNWEKEQSPQSVGQCPVCESKNIRKDYDFPDTMMCCDDCGSDFYNDGEIVLNGRTLNKPEQVGHTPGEWLIENFGSKFDVYASTQKGKTVIATTETRHIHHIGTDEAEANARLIVSAVNNTAGKGINPEAVPDLLEALKEVYSEFEWTLSEEKSDSRRISIEKALTAINKATKQ